MTKTLQCKDISDLPILRLLTDLPPYDSGTLRTWGNWFTNPDGTPLPGSVLQAMPAGTPGKLALYKMSRLIRKGLVDGCTCGCRGDFELTGKGREYLEQHK